jgi:metal transporter CNNM
MPPFETKQEFKEAKYARGIYPLRRRANLLLCAILITNVAINSLFSIIVSDSAGGTVGFVVSTVIILLFGEIIP